LRNGLFHLSRINGAKSSRALVFRGTGSLRYMTFILDPDEEVIINPEYLAGFSDSIRFRTHWDFNLAMLAMHRPSSFLARGPGRLILKIHGEPNICTDAATAPSIDFGNLVLFSQGAKFHIEASKGLMNYLLSGCLVKPRAGRLFVAAPGSGRKSSRVGSLWQLIKQVYIPI
jgi:uncharacterized protein (AIM24 family)